jgi:hypothetical protein
MKAVALWRAACIVTAAGHPYPSPRSQCVGSVPALRRRHRLGPPCAHGWIRVGLLPRAAAAACGRGVCGPCPMAQLSAGAVRLPVCVHTGTSMLARGAVHVGPSRVPAPASGYVPSCMASPPTAVWFPACPPAPLAALLSRRGVGCVCASVGGDHRRWTASRGTEPRASSLQRPARRCCSGGTSTTCGLMVRAVARSASFVHVRVAGPRMTGRRVWAPVAPAPEATTRRPFCVCVPTPWFVSFALGCGGCRRVHAGFWWWDWSEQYVPVAGFSDAGPQVWSLVFFENPPVGAAPAAVALAPALPVQPGRVRVCAAYRTDSPLARRARLQSVPDGIAPRSRRPTPTPQATTPHFTLYCTPPCEAQPCRTRSPPA